MSCRLFLVTPPGLGSADLPLEPFIAAFRAALSSGDVASVLLRGAAVDEETLEQAVRALCPIAQDADAAFLVEGRADLAANLNCDGLQIEARPATISAVRRALGNDMIVGVECHDSRHSAMLAGEAGADYVTFDATEIELISWWAELMEVPCVAWGGITLESAPELIDTGVEFLAVGQAIWGHSKGPAAAVKAFQKLIDQA